MFDQFARRACEEGARGSEGESQHQRQGRPAFSWPGISFFVPLLFLNSATKPNLMATAKKAPAKSTASAAPAKKKASGAFTKALTLSPALAAVIGPTPVPRTEIVKLLWVYIKEHDLQDKTNKRNINADAKLLEVFGKPQVTMFEMAGLIGKHVS